MRTLSAAAPHPGHPSPRPSAIRRSLLGSAVLGLLPGMAAAVDLNYELGVSVLQTDNVALASFDETSETVLSPSVRFDLEQRGSSVQAKARGSVAYVDYLSNTFDSDVRGELAGELNWTVVPQRMDFVVSDYLNRQPVSVLTSFNPGNQQQVNVFIAGPSFYARLGSTFRGQLDLRYANSHAETSKDFNGDHYNAAARVLRDTSANQTISLNLESTRSEYRNPVFDYTRNDAYIGYSLALAALELTADVGYSHLQLNDGSSDRSQPMARASATWTPTPSSTFTAVARHQFSNAAQDMIARARDLDGSIMNELNSNDVLVGASSFRRQEFYLGYYFTSERLGLHVQPYYTRARYIGNPPVDPGQDPAAPAPDPGVELADLQRQHNYGTLFSMDYKLRPQSTLSLVLAYDVGRFDAIDRKDRNYFAALSFANRLTRHWSWRADLQHRQRNSSTADASYDENAFVLSIAYLR
ncbi:DUF560 domain-containing protein [Lysobacter sp. CW239]|nr:MULTISPECIES: outer membrane beta-barrel protein [Lysobacter]QOD92039.1 DUF560 domain-containing protein [Lysobacter sp. CW239]